MMVGLKVHATDETGAPVLKVASQDQIPPVEERYWRSRPENWLVGPRIATIAGVCSLRVL